MANGQEMRIKKIYDSMNVLKPFQSNCYALIKEVSNLLKINLYYYDEISEANTLGGEYNIFLNENQSKQKIWQDFGHELGHILNHEGVQREMNPMFRSYQEWQAIKFAHHFCVPTFMLEQLEFPRTEQEATGLVSELFHVENDFAKKRLEYWKSGKSLIMNRKAQVLW